ncbi:amine oxidase [Marasmius fiardii PR-910]|nr:amine oxidase [Marasmius fiardii PR-910]
MKRYQESLKLPIEESNQPQIEAPRPKVERIAVVGAGVSGLLAALRFGKTAPVDVYEALGRVGGRLYTYKFLGGGEWDYFDVGAMRFPMTEVMKLTYDLLKELEIPLLDYQDRCGNTWDKISALVRAKGGVYRTSIEGLTMNVFGRFLAQLRADHQQGYQSLMEYDDHSVRSFMALVELRPWVDPKTGESFSAKERYPTPVINWLETMTTCVGEFDQIPDFMEANDSDCRRHGSQRVADKMFEILTSTEPYRTNVKIHLNAQVTRIDYERRDQDMAVTWKSPKGTDGLAADILRLAVSPSGMRYMDLSTCMLDYGQRSALLMLQPAPAVKVGMKFKRNWWADQDITGGESSTDRRLVVYPSYGKTQDATIMGSWVQGHGSFDEERLKDLILPDLAIVHGISLQQLEDDYEGMYPFNWTHHSKTMGGFAYFAPGQFRYLLENLTRPAAQGRLHFAGEAVTVCHTFVVGAVESANRVVNQIKFQTLEHAVEAHGVGDVAEGVGRTVHWTCYSSRVWH